MSALGDLLRGQPLSARQAADKAEEMGVYLPYGTIAAYWAGSHGRPSAKTLRSLAAVVGISERRLQEAAWGAAAPLGPYAPPREAIHLNARQRRAFDELIRSVVAVVAEEGDDLTADDFLPRANKRGVSINNESA